MSDEYVGVPGQKMHLSIRVDGVTYAILSHYAKHLGLPTANHGAFALVVNGVKQLREQYAWAEEAYHAGTMVDMEHRKAYLQDEH